MVLFEAAGQNISSRPPITPGYAPTGRWFIAPPETIREHFNYAEQVSAAGKDIIDTELADYLMDSFMEGQGVH